MDRKLFLSYIQNMQQNNPDMIGFQNSLTKNSWLKPKSLYETNDDEYQVPERDFDEEEVMKKIRDELPDLAAEAHKQFLKDGGTGHPKDYWGKWESRDLLATHKNIENKWHFLSDSGRDDLVGDFRAHIDDIHAAHMADQEAAGRDWAADRGMTHGDDPHNPLREAVIQMNEVKANVHGEFPFTVYDEKQDATSRPSGASMDKRSLIRYAAEAALKDQNHWIYDPKHHNIRRALFNFTNKNTQQEDLDHIVTFMKMDPKFKKDLAELDADIENYGHF